MDITKQTDYLVAHWNPFTTYTSSMKQIKAWFQHYGRSAFYHGKTWTLKYDRLCPGVYDVRFEAAA